MRYIMISAEARQLIIDNVSPGFEFSESGERMPDGRWKIPLGDDTIARIEAHKLPNETLGETIERILATRRGAN